MKKFLKIFLISLLILVTLIGTGMGLLTTEGGTRILLRAAFFLSSYRIDAQEIKGKILEELTLEGCKITWGHLDLKAKSLRLKWRGKDLLQKEMNIQQVILQGVEIHDRRPDLDTPPDLRWPSIPFWLPSLKGQIQAFQVDLLNYRKLNQSPSQIDNIFFSMALENRRLKVMGFSLQAPWGSGRGSGEASLDPPSLHLALDGKFTRSISPLEDLSLRLDLKPAAGPEQMAGTMRLLGRDGPVEKIRVEGNLGITRNTLRLHSFRIEEAGRQGAISGDGEISFARRPPFRLRLAFTGLNLEPELGIRTKISGSLEARGAPEKYSGQFRLANSGPGWEEIRISGGFQGNRGACEFRTLDASLLDGSLKGKARLSWVDIFSLEGQIHGRGLNPAVVDPGWKGKINVNLDGELRFPAGEGPQGRLKAHLLESQILSKPLEGDMNLELDGKDFRLSPLRLQGPGFVLRAEGRLAEKVGLEVRITDPSALIPGLTGTIHGTGWIRWKEGILAGSLTAQGKDIFMGGAAAKTLEGTVHLKEFSKDRKPSIALEASLGHISAGPFQAGSLQVNLSGNSERHRANFDLRHGRGKILGALTGAYREGLWDGAIQALQGQDPTGHWFLQAPASLALSSRELRLSPLRIASAKGEKTELSSSLLFHPLRGSFLAQWQQVDLAHANLWLRKGRLTGRTNGSLAAKQSDGQTHLTGSLDLKGSFALDSLHLDVSSGKASWEWGPLGLSASAQLALEGGGKLQAQLSSPEPLRSSLPEKGSLEADWEGLDLAILRSFFPPSLRVDGRLSGRLNGRWLPGWNLEAASEAQIQQGFFRWRRDTGPIEVAVEKAELNWAWREKMLRGDLSLALAKYGWVKSQFNLPLSATIPPAIQASGPIQVTVQGQAQERGLLAAIFPDRIEESRGDLGFTVRASGTWEKPIITGSGRLNDAAFYFPLRPHAPSPEKGKTSPPFKKLLKLDLSSGRLDFRLDEGGLQAACLLDLNGKGTFQGTISSREPARMALPEQGQLQANFSNLDMALIRPFLPSPILLDGLLSGNGSGQWFPGGKFDLTAQFKATGGMINWKRDGGQISAHIDKADLNLAWKEEELRGNLSLALAKYGGLKGTFQIPLPARLPPAVHPAGPLRVSLEGQAMEAGLVTALFPGVIEESQGKIELDLRATGTWEKPQLKGHLHMTQAGAKIPGLGIQVKDLDARLQIEDEEIRIESLRAQSGPGRIEGKGKIRLEGWSVARYEGRLQGERFQALYLPEVRIQGNPDLKIQGDAKKMTVRGEVLFSEFLVYGEPAGQRIRRSSDTVIIDEPPRGRKFPLDLDIQVRLILGNRVVVSAQGIDARLEGNLDLKATGIEKATAQGEIRVAEGHYSTIGLRLKILRGRFSFTGGPVDRPELDIQAMKKVKDIEVGVLVTGTPQNPMVRLYSKPPMADTDILSYLVLGRPFSTSTSTKDVDVLMVAAGALLSRGESVSLQDRIKNFLWLDTVDIQSGSGDVARSMVTLGKYLTPDLYFSLGYSIFDNTQLITARYRVTEDWEIETKWGSQGGVDLFYKIEFY